MLDEKAQEAAREAAEAQVVQDTYIAPPSVPTGSLQALGQQILNGRGLGGYYYAMDFIISHESGWNLYAVNPSSGACGLVQALPCNKIVWGNASAQLNWFIDYCINRYGSLPGAYSYWVSHGNY